MGRRTISIAVAILALGSMIVVGMPTPAGATITIDPESSDYSGACPSGTLASLTQLTEYHPVGLEAATVQHYQVVGTTSTMDFVTTAPSFPPVVACINVDPLTGVKEILATVTATFGTDADQAALATAWSTAGLSEAKFEALMRSLDDDSLCVPSTQDCVSNAVNIVSDQNAYAYAFHGLALHGDTTFDGGWTWYKPKDSDPNYYYLPVRSWGTGHGSYWHTLTVGRAGTSYYTGGVHAPVSEFYPKGDINGSGTCSTSEYGISGYGVTLSRQVHKCSNKISVNLYSPNDYFRSQWNGASRGCQIYTEADQWGKKPNGTPDSLKLYLYTAERGAPPFGTTC